MASSLKSEDECGIYENMTNELVGSPSTRHIHGNTRRFSWPSTEFIGQFHAWCKIRRYG